MLLFRERIEDTGPKKGRQVNSAQHLSPRQRVEGAAEIRMRFLVPHRQICVNLRTQ